jgi:SAM-dependent methyltransferase
MSDEDDRDSAPGFRPRRSTVSVRRRSLRVPVDEVPRRSSPALTRPSFDKRPDAIERPLVSSEPLPALRTDPGVNVDIDEEIEVEESREMEVAPAARIASAPPAPTSAPSDAEMVIGSAELDAASFGELTGGAFADGAMDDHAGFGELAGEPTLGVAMRTSPDGELSPIPRAARVPSADEPIELAPEATQVSAPPMRHSIEALERTTGESVRSVEVQRAPEPAVRTPSGRPPSIPPPSIRASARPPSVRPPPMALAPVEAKSAPPPEPKVEAPPVKAADATEPRADDAIARKSERPSSIGGEYARGGRSEGDARLSQPVIVSKVVIVSRAIAVVGSPAQTPAPTPAATATPAATPPRLEVQPSSPPPPAPAIAADADGDALELDVEMPREPEAAADAAEPDRVSDVPELAEPDLLAADDEIIEDAPPPGSQGRSAPPPRPDRATGRTTRLTPIPPAMPPHSMSGPPASGAAAPHLPPPPPIPSIPSPAPAPPAASASAPAAAAPVAPALAAPPAPPVAHNDPPTDPRRTKKKGAWWEDLFNDDYLRTVPAPHPRQVSRQCDFIEQRLGLVRGATVLDVGCGLGLHAIELTRRGYLVVGLDLSLPMLSRAADEAQDQGFKINFLHGDMREMNFDGAFDAVLSWGTSFGYFDDDVNRGVLDRIHRALKPGGLFLLDLVNRDYVVRTQPNNVWFEGDGCVVMEETQCNYISSRLHVKRTVMLDDGRQRESAYAIRLYSLHELGQMLHKNFRVVEVSGREATPGVFFGADSPRLLVVAERRVAAPAAPPGPPAPPKKPEDPAVSSAPTAVAPAAPPSTDHEN